MIDDCDGAEQRAPSRAEMVVTTIATATGHPDGQRRATRAPSSTASVQDRRGDGCAVRRALRVALASEEGSPSSSRISSWPRASASGSWCLRVPANIRSDAKHPKHRRGLAWFDRYRSPLRDARHPKQATLLSGHRGRLSARRRPVPVWIGKAGSAGRRRRSSTARSPYEEQPAPWSDHSQIAQEQAAFPGSPASARATGESAKGPNLNRQIA